MLMISMQEILKLNKTSRNNLMSREIKSTALYSAIVLFDRPHYHCPLIYQKSRQSSLKGLSPKMAASFRSGRLGGQTSPDPDPAM
jgi:hypothetical protein